LKYARKPDVRPPRAQAAIIKHSQHDQQTASAREPQQGSHFAVLGDHPVCREYERNTGDKNEHGEEEVVKVKPLPLRMAELRREKPGHAVVVQLAERAHQGTCSDDPEHVKTAQGI